MPNPQWYSPSGTIPRLNPRGLSDCTSSSSRHWHVLRLLSTYGPSTKGKSYEEVVTFHPLHVVQNLYYIQYYLDTISAGHEHVGLDDGLDTRFEGFVCEQPAAYPPTVSSTAASYAFPQLGSLEVDISSSPTTVNSIELTWNHPRHR